MAMGHFIEIHNLFSISLHLWWVKSPWKMLKSGAKRSSLIHRCEKMLPSQHLSKWIVYHCLPNISKTHQKSNSQNNPEAVSSALRGVSPTLSLGRWWNSRWSRMKPWSAGPCQNSLKFTVIITIILDHTSLQLLFLTPKSWGMILLMYRGQRKDHIMNVIIHTPHRTNIGRRSLDPHHTNIGRRSLDS